MDLQARLFALTSQNVSKARNARSINELIVEILKDGAELTRTELITRVAQLRYEDANGVITDETFDDPEFEDKFKKISMTAKNGVDTSVSHSNNNSSFHYNEAFKMWTLKEVGGKFRLTSNLPQEPTEVPVETPKAPQAPADKSAK